jgi:hypothetical protein
MLGTTFAPQTSLQERSRLPVLSSGTQISALELCCLLACGALGMFVVGAFHQLRIPVPGHAILRGALPMALGLALVPRRSSGLIMTIGAGLTAWLMNSFGVGRFPQAAVVSVLALGPIVDLALLGRAQSWGLYVRLAAAGAAANALAFATKMLMLKLGIDTGSGGNFALFGWVAFLSFIFFGALAGLISVAACFRAPPRGYPGDDMRRN